jgi:glycosyltransferase involved in cell wall biosynthesis
MKAYQLLNFPRSCVDFLRWPIDEAVLESIDGFMAVSTYTRDLVRTHLPQLSNVPVEVIPNPVTVPKPSFAPNDCQENANTILYASGSSANKGPHIALYAARKLLNEFSKEFTLTMLGVEHDVCTKNLVKRLKIAGHVRLLPRLPRSQVSAYMASSTAVLLPSLPPEPLGRVPIEANLLGTPAIVSNRGGLPETIVDKVTGLVTEPSVEAVARGLDEALRADWNRESIARIAKERFDPERIIDNSVRFLYAFI